MNLERDKFLTEQMGECWHEWEGHWTDYKSCKKCDSYNKMNNSRWVNNNFSTPDGFFKLFNWASVQPWFEDLLYNYWSCPSPRKVFPYHLIHPDRFADSLYKFLTGVFPSYYLEWKEKGRYEQN